MMDLAPKLRPYQEVGAQFLRARKAAILWDDPGLGKTPQAIVAAFVHTTVVVVCPPSVLYNWEREFAKWDPDRHVQIFNRDETPDDRIDELPHPNARRAILVSPSRLSTVAVMSELLGLPSIDLVVVDEAQMFKNPGAARTAALYSSGGLVGRASNVWLLSGTLCPNWFSEMWTHLAVLAPQKILTEDGSVMTYGEFLDHYCITRHVPNRDPRVIGHKSEAVAETSADLRDLVLRRRKAEVLPELPSVDYQNVVVSSAAMDPTDCVHMLELETSLVERLTASGDLDVIDSPVEPERPVKAATWISKQPEHSTLRRLLGEAKTPHVIATVKQELEDKAYQKVVIFAHHLDVITALALALEPFNPVVLTGSTPAKLRDEIVQGFQEDPGVQVFIGQTTAAGTGITLTAAQEVVVVEPPWTPSELTQAVDRCNRFGQTGRVRARIFSVESSFDDIINRILVRKAAAMAAVDTILEDAKP